MSDSTDVGPAGPRPPTGAALEGERDGVDVDARGHEAVDGNGATAPQAAEATPDGPDAQPAEEDHLVAAIRRFHHRYPDALPFAAVVLAATVWALKFSSLVILRHNRFGDFDFDSGIFGQAVWLSAHGAQFDTVRGLPLYGHHATFGFYLFAPASWLGLDVVNVMNVAQVLAIAVVPLIVYWIGRRLGLEAWIAAVAGFVCLSHFSTSWLAQELFHPEVFAIAPLLAAYGFALRDQRRAYWAMLLLAVIWKEDVALAILGLGAMLLIQHRRDGGARRRQALLTIAFAVVWFAVATQVLLPHFSPSGKAFYAEGFYGNLGDNFTSVAGSFVTHPSRVVTHLKQAHSFGYLRDLWAPFGFVNLLAPLTLLIALPQLLANLLSVQGFTWSLHFHYVALPLAASMLGFVLGLRRLRGKWRTFAAGIALAASIGTAASWGIGPFTPKYEAGYWPIRANSQQTAVEDALRLIPKGAPVSASYRLVGHLTDRELVFSFPNPWKPRNWGIHDQHQRDPRSVQWVIVRVADLSTDDQAVLDNSVLGGADPMTKVYDRDGVIVAKR